MKKNINKKEIQSLYSNETEFQRVTYEYLRASEILAEAAALAGDDSIKQEMLAFIQPKFIEMCAKSEGIRALAQQSFSSNREFILEEMKKVSQLNLEIARQIRDKLENL